MADRFVKENGYEALEKFIAIKGAKPINDVEEIKAVTNTEKKEVATAIQVDCRDNIAVEKELNCKEPNVAQKHMKGVEMAEKKAATMANRVKCAEPNLEQAEKRTVEDVQIKEMTAAADRENKLPEITISKEVQKEWTCAACQMTMLSEANLNSHLQGRKHKAKCEGLKGGKQTDKNTSSSYSMTNESDQTNREPKKRARRRRKKSGTTTQEEKVQVGGTGDQCKQKNVMNIDAETKSTFWCGICNVMCPDEIHMASHLSGWNQSLIQEMFGFGGCAPSWV
ncbi:hypothetical protein F0562_020877 [Nyssa sinensis]|uniref:C2H2-type domain-containing protein n=1 Tax=Nyssa sinensis TaxID=561372 RepID=A0A5J5BVR1_9ASTE|nr:hypothetical protein F0562_020877 [Nyssa sinensis]